MASISSSKLVSVADYLSGELTSETKHEYLGGVIYATASGSNAHNLIASRLTRLLFSTTAEHPCEPYNSDTKIRVDTNTQTRFYYPDVSVIFSPNHGSETYQDKPVLVAEVLSHSTRRTDETEKKDAYLSLPTLQVYLLVEQDRPCVTVHRRNKTGGFDPEVYEGRDAVVPLAEIETELPLSEVYQGIELTPEPTAGEQAASPTGEHS